MGPFAGFSPSEVFEMSLKFSVSHLLLAAAALLVGSSAEAGLVTSVSSSNAAVAQVTGVSSAVFGGATGSFTVDLDVFQLHVPIQLTFNYAADPTLTRPATTDYTVTLRVKNSVTAVGQNLDFNGFDLTNNATVGGDVASAGLRFPAPITSNVFGVQKPAGNNIPGGFRWGGLLGGGPRLAPAAIATNTFVYRVTWGNVDGFAAGSSALNFTANPEPATLLLGSLVMAPAAWVIRRRRKAVAELEAASV
jgi:hypothetical protein